MISRLFTRVRLGHVSRTQIRSRKPARELTPAELKALREQLSEAVRGGVRVVAREPDA